MSLLILLGMLGLHIVDMFGLNLLSLKMASGKSWYTPGLTLKRSKPDSIIPLLTQGFSWSILVHVPIIALLIIENINPPTVLIFITVILQGLVHAYISNENASFRKLNFVENQILHLVQIISIFIIFYYIT